jgi:hypothetical protein
MDSHSFCNMITHLEAFRWIYAYFLKENLPSLESVTRKLRYSARVNIKSEIFCWDWIRHDRFWILGWPWYLPVFSSILKCMDRHTDTNRCIEITQPNRSTQNRIVFLKIRSYCRITYFSHCHEKWRNNIHFVFNYRCPVPHSGTKWNEICSSYFLFCVGSIFFSCGITRTKKTF